MTSFATRFGTYDRKQPITVYGTEGTLKVPDPNTFDGPVSIQRIGQENFEDVPHCFVPGYGRSIGAADMAYAIRSGRPHRASAEQAMSVLDLMQGFLDSSEQGKHHTPTTAYERPRPMPAELSFGTLDE